MLEKPEKHPSNLPNLQEVELCAGVVDGHQLVCGHHKLLICLPLICASDGEGAGAGGEGARRRAGRSAGCGERHGEVKRSGRRGDGRRRGELMVVEVDMNDGRHGQGHLGMDASLVCRAKSKL